MRVRSLNFNWSKAKRNGLISFFRRTEEVSTKAFFELELFKVDRELGKSLSNLISYVKTS